MDAARSTASNTDSSSDQGITIRNNNKIKVAAVVM